MFTLMKLLRLLYAKLAISIIFIESKSKSNTDFHHFYFRLSTSFTLEKLKKKVEQNIHIHNVTVKTVENEDERDFHIKNDRQLIMFLENETKNEVGWRYSVQLMTRYRDLDCRAVI